MPTTPTTSAPDAAAPALCQQVQAQLRGHDLAGAQRTAGRIAQVDYQGFAWRDIAQAQALAGELTSAEASAQHIPYEDPRGEAVLSIVQAHLQQGDMATAQQLATTIPYATSWPAAVQAIAAAQAQAGNDEAARQTLVAAQQHLQTWSEGDSRMGYPRAYYLAELVRAQLAIGDRAGAEQTAQTITVPEYRARALQAVGPA